jgi:hypothetical protein
MDRMNSFGLEPEAATPIICGFRRGLRGDVFGAGGCRADDCRLEAEGRNVWM